DLERFLRLAMSADRQLVFANLQAGDKPNAGVRLISRMEGRRDIAPVQRDLQRVLALFAHSGDFDQHVAAADALGPRRKRANLYSIIIVVILARQRGVG